MIGNTTIMNNGQLSTQSLEMLTKSWNDALQVANEIPSELIGADPKSVQLGEYKDYDYESGRGLTVKFDEQGKPTKVDLSFVVSTPVEYGSLMRMLTLDQDGLGIEYSGGYNARLLVRHGEVIQFGSGIGEKRQRQALGYLSIIGESIRDALERNTFEA